MALPASISDRLFEEEEEEQEQQEQQQQQQQEECSGHVMRNESFLVLSVCVGMKCACASYQLYRVLMTNDPKEATRKIRGDGRIWLEDLCGQGPLKH